MTRKNNKKKNGKKSKSGLYPQESLNIPDECLNCERFKLLKSPCHSSVCVKRVS